jgi:hypothetical protein
MKMDNGKGPRTLVLFVFFHYDDLVKSFFKNALFKDDSVDFVVISNNPTVDFEVPPYVTKIQRENVGYDFGGWSHGLLDGDRYLGYDNFIFVNSTVVGPFLPSYYKGKWTDIYIGGLENGVYLFGSTINTCKRPEELSHVQSYIFSMRIDTLRLLMMNGIFSTTNYVGNRSDAINKREIMMSNIVRHHGGNIGCLINDYQGVDFTFRHTKPSEKLFRDDLMKQKFMDSGLWTKHELVFVKGNRINCRLP